MADPFVAEIRIFPFNFAPTGWAFCDGQLLPIPINLDTVNRLYGFSLTSDRLKSYFESVAEPKRLMATVPPLSCSALLTPALPIKT